MATTPPSQITRSPQTPSTPLHGAAYDRTHPRQSARISQRLALQESQQSRSAHKENSTNNNSSRTVTTPRSTKKASQHSPPRSPQLTPKHLTNRRVQILSPPSPDQDVSAPKPVAAPSINRKSFLSSTTIMSDGMLPTPVKTPKKKQIPKMDITARALFQEHPLVEEEIQPSPRRARKNKRYNGFSLESFSVEDDGKAHNIQIFTDSRDQIPEADTTEQNPFVEQTIQNGLKPSQRLSRTSKRRKISGEKPKDPQVEEAIQDDEGMVYVFRGKKIYRRFDDAEDEEEEIDASDLGLLEHAADGILALSPLKTLTRRSIRPKRLFQDEQQKLTNAVEKDEEALTDIEEPSTRTIQATRILASDESDIEDSELNQPKSGKRQIRRVTAPSTMTKSGSGAIAEHSGADKPKKASPFDSWPRVKAGTRSDSVNAKGKKRVASEAVDEHQDILSNGQPSHSKKTRA